MKKKVILLAALFAGATSFAQDLTSKKGETILPEAGDWAIQFDATPFLDFAGNLFNSGATAPGAQWVDPNMAIVGKYFVDAETAYRVRLNLGFGSTTNNANTADLDPDADAGDLVADSYKKGGATIVIGGGMEKRKGAGRLQGFYGGEIAFAITSSKETFEYGNAFDFDDGITSQDNAAAPAGNTNMESTKQGTFGLNLRGFVGVEYFLAPKISIGAEYGWGLGFMSTGDGEAVNQQLNDDGDDMESNTTTTLGGSSFGLGTDINGGNANLGTASLTATFHF